VKDFISWLLSIWPILAVLGGIAITVSGIIIKHDFNHSKIRKQGLNKTNTGIDDRVIPQERSNKIQNLTVEFKSVYMDDVEKWVRLFGVVKSEFTLNITRIKAMLYFIGTSILFDFESTESIVIEGNNKANEFSIKCLGNIEPLILALKPVIGRPSFVSGRVDFEFDGVLYNVLNILKDKAKKIYVFECKHDG